MELVRNRRIFLFEFATAGGAWDELHRPQLVEELRAEGRAMFQALAADLVAAGYELTALVDEQQVSTGIAGERRVSTLERKGAFNELAGECDGIILIAPEIDGILLRLAQAVEQQSARLLSPSAEFVAIAANKHSTAERLRSHSVPAPLGVVVPAATSLDAVKVPWKGRTIAKPVDGAGSWAIQELDSFAQSLPFNTRLEPFCPGTPASVAVLCGPGALQILEPCYQRLGGTSGFQYLGGALPLPCSLAVRAKALARQVISALPPTMGYVGIDLILGQLADGTEDIVIEVNPRLTTSYVGLRKAYCENLAAAWIKVANGSEFELSLRPGALEFFIDGCVRGSSD